MAHERKFDSRTSLQAWTDLQSNGDVLVHDDSCTIHLLLEDKPVMVYSGTNDAVVLKAYDDNRPHVALIL